MCKLFRGKEDSLWQFQSIGENIHDKNDSQISELLLFDVYLNNDSSNGVFWMLQSNTYSLLQDLTSLLGAF